MRGFPKNFATQADVDLCMQQYPDEMKAKIGEWLDNRYCTESKPLDSKDAGKVDEFNSVEVQKDGSKLQITKKEDPNCKLSQLGIALEAAQAIVEVNSNIEINFK
jgi:hypothetical protein